MRFAVQCTPRAGDTVVAVEGELDISTVRGLGEAVEKVLTEPPHQVYLDLTPTTFIDSRGCREIVAAVKACEVSGAGVALVVPPENRHVRRVVDLVQVGVLVRLLDTLPPS